MKGVKNETELNHDREAHLRDAVAMVRFQKELEERLAAGEELTELTVDEILHKYRSAQDKFIVESFGTIAAYGGNAAMMHYHATEEDHAKLEKKGFCWWTAARPTWTAPPTSPAPTRWAS